MVVNCNSTIYSTGGPYAYHERILLTLCWSMQSLNNVVWGVVVLVVVEYHGMRNWAVVVVVVVVSLVEYRGMHKVLVVVVVLLVYRGNKVLVVVVVVLLVHRGMHKVLVVVVVVLWTVIGLWFLVAMVTQFHFCVETSHLIHGLNNY